MIVITNIRSQTVVKNKHLPYSQAKLNDDFDLQAK